MNNELSEDTHILMSGRTHSTWASVVMSIACLVLGVQGAYAFPPIVMVRVDGGGDPGGEFEGQEYGPVPYQFYISRHEITNEQFLEFANENRFALTWFRSERSVFGPMGLVYFVANDANFREGSDETYVYATAIVENPPYATAGDDAINPVLDYDQHPMISVTWFGAAAFCNWLSRNEGRSPVYNETTWEAHLDWNGYRLPTLDEWFKASAWDPELETYQLYGFGRDSVTPGDGNFAGNGDPYERERSQPETTPVGFFNGLFHPPDFQTSVDENAYGLSDMSGNVAEWLHDEVDGINDNPLGGHRWVRGGSYEEPDVNAQTTYIGAEASAIPALPDRRIGFRVVRGRTDIQDSDGDGVPDDVDVCPNTPPDAIVDPVGRPTSDLNRDCETDLRDFSAFLTAFAGPK